MSGRGQDAGALAMAVRELEIAWQRSGEAWRDRARSGFEREHYAPVLAALEDALKGVTTATEITRRVRHACGTEPGSRA